MATHPVIGLLQEQIGRDMVIADPGELYAYECDGFPIAKARPLAVVFPRSTEQVIGCVNTIREQGLPIIPRGSGTGLAGGCVAFDSGVIVSTTRMTRIESIDLANRTAVVQAGVRNLDLSDAVAELQSRAQRNSTGARAVQSTETTGLRFSPDPSSQTVSTIGGNAATNAGGINTLKHGVTTTHVLATELILSDGTLITSGACLPDPGQPVLYDGFGPDTTALICGSEGTLGIITRVWCRLTPIPTHSRSAWAIFNTSRDACQAVSDIIADGVIPASMEMLDGEMIRVVEQAFAYGFPPDAQALLLIELDGNEHFLDGQLTRVMHLLHDNHAVDIRHFADPTRQEELWSVRKRAFGAIGRISRSYCTQDACIPRSCLADALTRIGQISRESGMRITNVFHAGDGNVHPILLFDEDDPAQVQAVLQVSERILEYCISIGGTITGEHGIGVEKLHLMSRMFTTETLDVFKRIKHVFDPEGVINDGKMIPSDRVSIQLIKPLSTNQPGGAL